MYLQPTSGKQMNSSTDQIESIRNFNMALHLILWLSIVVYYVLTYYMDVINGVIGSTFPLRYIITVFLLPCLFEIVICSFHTSKIFVIKYKGEAFETLKIAQIAS
jgi:uncharacterized membrane protein YhdT